MTVFRRVGAKGLKIASNWKLIKKKKQVFEIQFELIKLVLNSCYGFTLCNITSNKFKMLENRRNIPTNIKSKNQIKSCIQLGDKMFLAELNKQVKEPFQTLLGHVGCYIYFVPQ